jgi:FAD dependent oxidoreductase TIGR03364
VNPTASSIISLKNSREIYQSSPALKNDLRLNNGVTERILVVGGGIIGTMHALLACEAGYEVLHIERDLKPTSASVRNFGLVWVSGRDTGPELRLALRARSLWSAIGGKAEIGFRPNGSLTIASNEAEMNVLYEAANMDDAHLRGFRVLTNAETRALEPMLAGKYLGALQCTEDAVVEPPILLGGLRNYLSTFSTYFWKPGCEIADFYHDSTGNHIVDTSGNDYSSDYVVFCAGAAHGGFLSDYMAEAPVRKVRLQMAATVPLKEKLGHSLADGDSLRYYPAFKNLSVDQLPPQSRIASERYMQLLLVQRIDGSMTIGDTHEYDEPFDHLRSVITSIFGREAPSLGKRWDGVYSQSTNSEIYFRKEIAPGAVIVTGGGGRGNTLSPAIAEETLLSWRN